MSDSADAHAPISRRAVNAFLGLGVVSAVTGFVGSTLAYLWPSAGAAGSDLLTTAQGPVLADTLGLNDSVVGRSRFGKILVVRRGEELVGLQATCTHLGCTVSWNSASQEIECPCHGARYNLHGDVVRGPARDPLGQVRLAVLEGEGIHVLPPLEG